MPLYLLSPITSQPTKVGSVAADGSEPAVPDGEHRSAAGGGAEVRAETVLGLAEEAGHEVGALWGEAGMGREFKGVLPVEAGEVSGASGVGWERRSAERCEQGRAGGMERVGIRTGSDSDVETPLTSSVG